MKVFVYGTLKKGYGNHRCLDGAKFIKETITKPIYDLVDVGYFPGLVSGNNAIQGEIYEINDSILKRLDNLEGYRGKSSNSNLYNRIIIKIEDEDIYTYKFNRSSENLKKIKPIDNIVTWKD